MEFPEPCKWRTPHRFFLSLACLVYWTVVIPLFFWSLPFVQLLAKVLFEDGVRQCVPHDWVQHLQNNWVPLNVCSSISEAAFSLLEKKDRRSATARCKRVCVDLVIGSRQTFLTCFFPLAKIWFGFVFHDAQKAPLEFLQVEKICLFVPMAELHAR